MNPRDPQILEAASLPPNHPERKALEARLASFSPEERAHWALLLRETDLLYESLGDVQLPNYLASKLLQIPDHMPIEEQPTIAPASRWKLRVRPWQAAAAVLFLVAFISGIYYLNRDDTSQTYQGPPLAQATVDQISNWAVNTHEKPPALEVVDADPAKVQDQLKSMYQERAKTSMMPVIVIHPNTADAKLAGGGICDYFGKPAIFTRWQKGGLTYTLYQMDRKDTGAPTNFARATVQPKGAYQVLVWPGGPCTWALVKENTQAPNIFEGMYY